jgi:acetyl esterase/lipase
LVHKKNRFLISYRMRFPRPLDLINRCAGRVGMNISRDLAYGANPRQAMDIYAPLGEKRDLPVIVFFYGGSWQSGRREDYVFVAALLVARGFVVAVPDYRVYPETRYPGFIEDCAAAVHFVAANITEFGGSPESIFLLGHSAGAYNAVMVALRADAPVLAGVVGLAGPYDFLPLKDPVLMSVFSGPEDQSETQPITHAHAAAPPMFLATGAADDTVLPRNTTAMAASLRRLGAVVETRIYPKLGHVGILLGLVPYLGWRGAVMRDLVAFCTVCLGDEFTAPRSDISTSVVRRTL